MVHEHRPAICFERPIRFNIPSGNSNTCGYTPEKMSLNHGLNPGRHRPSLINSPTVIIQSATFLFICGHLVSREESLTLRKNNCLLKGDESHTDCAIATPSGRAIETDCVACSSAQSPFWHSKTSQQSPG